jgi:hypothetical protein
LLPHFNSSHGPVCFRGFQKHHHTRFLSVVVLRRSTQPVSYAVILES